MTYPSIKDYEYPNIWYEDSEGNIYKEEAKTLELSVPNVSGEITYHSCFPMDIHENVSLIKDNQFERLFTGTSGCSRDLVLAMTRPSFKERLKSVFRTFKWMPVADIDQAMRHASRCERCMNALAYVYGLDWGYKPFSEEWHKSGTSCKVCKDINTNKLTCTISSRIKNYGK